MSRVVVVIHIQIEVLDKDQSALDLTSDGDLMEIGDISQSSLSGLEAFLDRSAQCAASMNKLMDLSGGCGASAAGRVDCQADIEAGGSGEFVPAVGDEVQVQDKKVESSTRAKFWKLGRQVQGAL